MTKYAIINTKQCGCGKPLHDHESFGENCSLKLFCSRTFDDRDDAMSELMRATLDQIKEANAAIIQFEN